MKCTNEKELLLLEDGLLREEDGRALRSHLSDCQVCRALQTEVTGFAARLRSTSPHYKNEGRSQAIMGRLEDEPVSSSVSRRFQGWLLGPALAAGIGVAALAGIFVIGPSSQEGGGFQSRGSVLESDLGRWVGIRVFALSNGEGSPVPLSDAIEADDRLLFSYTNLKPSPFRYLRIVAKDSRGHIHRIHPAEDGPGLSIHPGMVAQEIPESVRLPLPPGLLTIVAAFSREGSSLHEFEAHLLGQPSKKSVGSVFKIRTVVVQEGQQP